MSGGGAEVLLLFDIDGTLLAPQGAGQRAMLAAGKALFGPAFTFDGIDTSGKIDPLIFAEVRRANDQLDIRDSDHHHLRDRYLRHLDEELATQPSRVLPGVVGLLELLRVRQATTLGLLTGNYAAAAARKLRSAALDPDWFPVAAFGDEATSRPGLVPVARRRYRERHGFEVPPERVIVIGDTPRDIDCAHANGCLAFAVATGRWSAASLRDAGADVVVDDLTDPDPLLELLLG